MKTESQTPAEENMSAAVLDHLNQQEREVLFGKWLAQARNHRTDAWMNWQLAEAHVQRLEEEKKKWGS